MYALVTQGALLAERKRRDGEYDEAAVEAGSTVSAAAFLSGTRTTACFRAARRCRLLAVGSQQLDSLLVSSCCLSARCACGGADPRIVCPWQ